MRLKIFYGWWIVAACFLIGFLVSGVIFYGFTAFFDPLVREFGWSHTQVSFASSLRGLEMGLLAPLIGFLVDRLGSRKLLFAGVLTTGAGLILLSFIQSLALFYAAMILIAFGAGGCTSVVTMTAVSHWFRQNLGKAMAIMMVGFGASGLLLPLIVGLIDAYGWRTAVVSLGLAIWVFGIPLSLIVRDSPKAYGEVPDGMPRASGSASAPALHETAPRQSYLEILRDRSFLYLNIAEGIRFMALTAVVVHIMPHLGLMGTSRSRSGVIAAAIPLLSIAGRLVFGWLGDRFDKRRVMVSAFLLMALGMFALPFIDRTILLVLFLILFPSGIGGLTVLRGTIVRAHYDLRVFGSMMGIMMGFSAVGGIVGPTLAGWVFDLTRNYSIIWIGFGALLFVSMLFVMKFRPHGDMERHRPLTGTAGHRVPGPDPSTT